VTQLPSPQRRHPAPHQTKRLRPKTYSVAVYLVGAVILLEVAMFVLVFWLRAMVVSVDVHLPKGAANSPVTQTIAPPPAPTQHLSTPHNNPEFPVLPGLETTVVHPALLQVPTATDERTQIGTLNEEAKVFLGQNDYQSATDLLVKAEDIDPRDPTTLENLAKIYNLTNNPARALEYWQRLVDLGPGVGTVYASAKDHVLLMESGHDSSPLQEASSLARQIYVDSVEKTPVETRNGDAQFHVRAALMRKDFKMPNFDQKKLQPYVIFYQQMPDGSLVPDLGQRKGSFDDTFLFWGNKLVEPFGVDYIMPIPGTPGPNNTTQGKYYGFIIAIYYDKALQDVRSEPSDLAQRMALPQDIE
jgi:tetratricopeptide (TPR) repeat protein